MQKDSEPTRYIFDDAAPEPESADVPRGPDVIYWRKTGVRTYVHCATGVEVVWAPDDSVRTWTVDRAIGDIRVANAAWEQGFAGRFFHSEGAMSAVEDAYGGERGRGVYGCPPDQRGSYACPHTPRCDGYVKQEEISR